MTGFDLTLDQIVTVTESFYPSFSLLEFLTMMGGAVGLWLGMGVVQMVHVGAAWVTWIQSSLCNVYSKRQKNKKAMDGS